MDKKLTINILKEKRKDFKKMLLARITQDKDAVKTRDVLVCCGTGCESSKSEKIYNNFLEELKNNNLTDKVNVVKTGCSKNNAR